MIAMQMRAMMDGCANCDASVKGAGPTESSLNPQKISESSDTQISKQNSSKNHRTKNPMFRPFQTATDAPPIDPFEKVENGGSKNKNKSTSGSAKPIRSEFEVKGPLEQPGEKACNLTQTNAQSEGGTHSQNLPHSVQPTQ